jgi:hypothetical protein
MKKKSYLWPSTTDLANITVVQLLRLGRLLGLVELARLPSERSFFVLPRVGNSRLRFNLRLRLLLHVHGGRIVESCVVARVVCLRLSGIASCIASSGLVVVASIAVCISGFGSCGGGYLAG